MARRNGFNAYIREGRQKGPAKFRHAHQRPCKRRNAGTCEIFRGSHFPGQGKVIVGQLAVFVARPCLGKPIWNIAVGIPDALHFLVKQAADHVFRIWPKGLHQGEAARRSVYSVQNGLNDAPGSKHPVVLNGALCILEVQYPFFAETGGQIARGIKNIAALGCRRSTHPCNDVLIHFPKGMGGTLGIGVRKSPFPIKALIYILHPSRLSRFPHFEGVMGLWRVVVQLADVRPVLVKLAAHVFKIPAENVRSLPGHLVACAVRRNHFLHDGIREVAIPLNEINQARLFKVIRQTPAPQGFKAPAQTGRTLTASGEPLPASYKQRLQSVHKVAAFRFHTLGKALNGLPAGNVDSRYAT